MVDVSRRRVATGKSVPANPPGAGVIDEASLADDLADRVNRLFPLTRDPERFHVERDGIARDLRKMARRLRGGGERKSIHVWRAK